MSVNIIKDILNKYENKRNQAFYNLVQRKNRIYEQIPRLKEIEHEINSYAIQSAKSILIAETEKKDIYVKDLENKIDALSKERETLLKKANIPISDLEPKFECEKCNDTGFSNNQKCSCYIQQLVDYSYNDSNLENLKQQNFDNFNINVFSDVIDEKMNTSPKENMVNIKKRTEEFIDNFNNPNQKNLFFYGSTGLGKTYLSSCIANEILKKEKTVLYQTAPVLIDSLIEYKLNKNDKNSKLYNEVFNIDLLIIDDLGVEFTNSMRFEELFTIINTRLINSKKTIISTNFTLNDLQEKYDDRLVSRIVANYTILKFFGEDLRIKNR